MPTGSAMDRTGGEPVTARSTIVPRAELARELARLAEAARGDGALRVGDVAASPPAFVSLETELLAADGEAEFSLRVSWPAPVYQAASLVGILTVVKPDHHAVAQLRGSLTELGVRSELTYLPSADATDRAIGYAEAAERRGLEVVIACTARADRLASVVAACTQVPVIGLPLSAGRSGGIDSLISTVQAAPGVPVAAVSLDGARNAALLAARILALKYPDLRLRLGRERQDSGPARGATGAVPGRLAPRRALRSTAPRTAP